MLFIFVILALAALAYPWLARIPLAKNAVVAACFALGAWTVPSRGASPGAAILIAPCRSPFYGARLCTSSIMQQTRCLSFQKYCFRRDRKSVSNR